jgi:hypothetical protein
LTVPPTIGLPTAATPLKVLFVDPVVVVEPSSPPQATSAAAASATMSPHSGR